jgi:hypothetical protein
MHLTFANTFINARKLGSSFWLAACVIISSTFAFVLSLPVAIALDIPVDPVALSEALPFLVITVGFDKPLQLARAVFTHPEFAPATPPSTPVSASQVLQDAVARTGPSVIRDYAIEIAVLALGAVSGVSGLKEFCALAALILATDCIALFTFYIAVLNIMVEVRAPARLPACTLLRANFVTTRSRSTVSNPYAAHVLRASHYPPTLPSVNASHTQSLAKRAPTAVQSSRSTPLRGSRSFWSVYPPAHWPLPLLSLLLRHVPTTHTPHHAVARLLLGPPRPQFVHNLDTCHGHRQTKHTRPPR